jgi:hypothetical protein
VIARTTLQHVTREDFLNDDLKLHIEEFDITVPERLSDENFMTED